MSDMSSRSHEYASTTDFSRQINHAVLLLKKRHLRDDETGIAPEELAGACKVVHQTVRSLLHRLGGGPTADGGAEDFPEDVLLRIEERQRGNLDDFKEDLAGLDRALTGRADFGAEQRELLDSICEAADASASATFRKLWRR